MKLLKEWSIEAPWGNIALISWGNQRGRPVLLVHGRQDSVSTFIPLLEVLPSDYYYVGIDMPGHGKSDALPIGIALTRFFGVVVIDMAIKHLGWSKFIYIGHSMGSEQGLFYNAIYPDKISKIIFLDPGPALQRLVITNYPEFYKMYDDYYSNYRRYNIDDRVYTKSKALQSVMKAREMTEAQADIILSRNLKKIGDDQYMLSWDKRSRILIPTNCTPEYYYELFAKNAKPTLYITANQSYGNFYSRGKIIVDEIVNKWEENVKNFTHLKVDGNHDVHFINPGIFINEMLAFLNKDFSVSKL